VGRGTRRRGLRGAALLAGALAVGISLAEVASAPGASSGDGALRLKVDAVAYHLPGFTASGVPVGKGVVAVDPKVIPLGTKLYVPGYGKSVAADVGWAIKGKIIDLWMPNDGQARKWGRRTVTITVYR
jgi:3D (Asp-Asp-Asp) domain-containing protein